MANQANPKGKHKKLRTIIGVILIVIVALAAGVGVRWWQQAQEAAQAPPSSLPDTVTSLESLRDSGDNAAFEAELSKALADQSLSSETRYYLYVEQGHNEMQKGQLQAALDAYNKAQAIQNTMDVNRLLGDTYYELGNTAKAIEYYRKAIDLIPQNNPRIDDIKAEYEMQIKAFQDGTAGQDADVEPEANE